MRAYSFRGTFAFCLASALCLHALLSAAPAGKSGAKGDETLMPVSPLNLEIGCRVLAYSPMFNPAAGISMEFGLNPGWFINNQAALGIFFSYSAYWSSYRSSFLASAGDAWSPIAYPYNNLETALRLMLDGTLDEIDDHRWGITLRPPYPWFPFVKAYWLYRGIILKEGSGDTTVGGVTYVGSGGGYSIGTQGAGLELSMPLAPIRWPTKKWTDWLALSRVSVFGQWLAFGSGTVDNPRPFVSENFNDTFTKEFGNQVEFGLMASIGF